MNESDPTFCEQCEEGYRLLLGKECSKDIQRLNNQCENYTEDKANCNNLYFCEFTNRSYCSGEEEGNCFLYLNQSLCEKNDLCSWNPGNDFKCHIKNITHCSQLSPEDASTCSKCEDGYSLHDFNTSCIKYEEYFPFPLCFEYSENEEICNLDKRCEYTQGSFCRSKYYDYDYDFYTFGNCSLYLDKNLCEADDYCYWAEYEYEICHIKSIKNCVELNYEDTYKCDKCKDGYKLNSESTACNQSSSSQIIEISLFAYALILVLL